jgi:hypothetical protein
MSPELEKRRSLQTALVGGAVACVGIAALVIVGIVIDSTMGRDYPKFLDWFAQGAFLVSFVGIIRAVYVISTTPWSLTKEALRDREFWRLRSPSKTDSTGGTERRNGQNQIGQNGRQKGGAPNSDNASKIE